MAIRVCLFFLLILWSSAPYAAVVATFVAPDRSVTVHLSDEKCAIPVPPGLDKYLTKRATWTDKQAYKGCWGEHPQSPDHILMYFEDNTGGAVHRNAFTWAARG